MMTQTQRHPERKAPSRQQTPDHHSLRQVLEALVGKATIVSHPEAIKKTPLGHQLRHGVYHGKIVEVSEDLVVVAIDPGRADHKVEHNGEDGPVKLFVPIQWIKLVGKAREEIHIHI